MILIRSFYINRMILYPSLYRINLQTKNKIMLKLQFHNLTIYYLFNEMEFRVITIYNE